MKLTIDAAGRIVIPKAMRQQAGLGPGSAVEIRFENGRIEIEPVYLPVRLERRGRFLVAMPEVEVAPLTAEAVEETRAALHRGRASR